MLVSLLMGLGAVLGAGRTSGYGLQRLARLSVRWAVAVPAVYLTTVPTMLLMRYVP